MDDSSRRRKGLIPKEIIAKQNDLLLSICFYG